MTGKGRNIFGKGGLGFRFGKLAMIIVIMMSFLTGYNAVLFQQTYCYAQINNNQNEDIRDEIEDWDPVTDILDYTMLSGQCSGYGLVSTSMPPFVAVSTGTSFDIACLGGVFSCAPPGQGMEIAAELYAGLLAQLKFASNQLEKKLSQNVDRMTQAFLERLNQTELKMIEWWDTFWFYNWRPVLQDVTSQLSTALVEQSRVYQEVMDAKQANEAGRQMQENEVKDQEESRPSDNGCPTATVAGGVGRATSIGRGMRGAWQNQSQMVAGNKIGSPGAGGKAEYNKYRNDVYQNMFCDPNDNGGENVCANSVNPEFYNADTQVSKFIQDKLTVPQTGPNSDKMKKAVEMGIENLVGTPASDPIKKDVLSVPPGQELFLQRRAFIARHTAISSIPRSIAGARMPGSRIGKWVSELREEGGTKVNPAPPPDPTTGLPTTPFKHDPPLMTDQISGNPSYREIIHAITVDRFNSGKYAMSNMDDPAAVEMEKLTLQAFYLIQLRDYYELLERMALTLAVQISIQADNIVMPPVPDAPKRTP